MQRTVTVGTSPAGVVEVAVLHANHLRVDGFLAAAALFEKQLFEVIATVELFVFEVEWSAGGDHNLIASTYCDCVKKQNTHRRERD
jgi:hypothetical protein